MSFARHLTAPSGHEIRSRLAFNNPQFAKHYPLNTNSDFWCELSPPVEINHITTLQFRVSSLHLECDWYNVPDDCFFKILRPASDLPLSLAGSSLPGDVPADLPTDMPAADLPVDSLPAEQASTPVELAILDDNDPTSELATQPFLERRLKEAGIPAAATIRRIATEPPPSKRVRRDIPLIYKTTPILVKRGYYSTAGLLTRTLPTLIPKSTGILFTHDHSIATTKVCITMPRNTILTIPHHIGRLIGYYDNSQYVTIGSGTDKIRTHLPTDEDPWREIFITCDLVGAGLCPALFPGIIAIAKANRNESATLTCAPLIALTATSRIQRIRITLRNRYRETIPLRHILHRSPLVGLDFIFSGKSV